MLSPASITASRIGRCSHIPAHSRGRQRHRRLVFELLEDRRMLSATGGEDWRFPTSSGSPPEAVQPIADVAAVEDDPDTLMDLGPVFDDPDLPSGDDLTYAATVTMPIDNPVAQLSQSHYASMHQLARMSRYPTSLLRIGFPFGCQVLAGLTGNSLLAAQNASSLRRIGIDTHHGEALQLSPERFQHLRYKQKERNSRGSQGRQEPVETVFRQPPPKAERVKDDRSL